MKPSPHRLWVGLMIGLPALLLATTPAQAEETRIAAMLNPIGDDEVNAALLDAARTALWDLRFGVAVVEEEVDLESFKSTARRVQEESEAFVVFSLVKTESGLELCLGFLKAGNFGQLTRHIEMSTPLGISEAAAVVLKSWIEALIAESDEPAPEPVEKTAAVALKVEAPAAPPPPPPPSEGSPPAPGRTGALDRRLALFTGFDVWMFGATAPAFGIPAALSVRPVGDLHLFIGYEAVFHAEVDISVMRLVLKRHPVFLGGRFLFRMGRTALVLSLALTVDYVISEATPSDASITPYQIKRSEISVVPTVGWVVPLMSRLCLSVQVDARIALNRTQYLVAENYEMKSVYTAWPVQPALVIGLLVSIF